MKEPKRFPMPLSLLLVAVVAINTADAIGNIVRDGGALHPWDCAYLGFTAGVMAAAGSFWLQMRSKEDR